MKKTKSLVFSLCLFGSLALSVAQSSQPNVTVQIQSINALKNTASQLAESIQPEFKFMVEGAFASIPLQSLDRDRPVGLAVWAEIPGRAPQVALYLPVTGEDAFQKDATEAPGMFNDLSPRMYLSESGYQVLSNTKQLTEQTAKSWSPAGFAEDNMASTQSFSPENRSLVRMTAQLSENAMLRTQGLMGINIARVGMAQAMASGQADFGQLGFDPKGMMDIMELYFKVGETLIRGFKDLQTDLGISDGVLMVEDQVHALDGSELSDWMTGGDWTGGMENLLGVSGPDDLVTLGIAIGRSETFLNGYGKLIEASMKMQGVVEMADFTGAFVEMGEKMLPVRAGGAMTMSDDGSSLEWLFAYDFSGSSLKEVYPLFSEFVEMFKKSGMVGEDKMYSAMEWAESVATYSGHNIDRMTMTLNLDSPLFKMPGQKEMMEFMYGGSSVKQDYAKLENILVGGTPSKLKGFLSQQKDADLKYKPAPGSKLLPDENTFFFLSAKLGKIVSGALKVVAQTAGEEAQQALGPVAAMLGTLDDRLEMKVNLDHGLRAVTRLPVRSIGVMLMTGYTTTQPVGVRQN